jgi:hypothetical protein
MMAFHAGSGIVGALLVGMAAGALTLTIGQVAFAACRSFALRIAIATAFAVPAVVAGYHLVFALSHIAGPSLAWREAFACLGALCVGGTAWTRLAAFAEARPLEPAGVVDNPSQPVLTAATREG